MRRIEFHGIAGLLGHFASNRLPQTLGDEVRQTAIAQVFWEAQHLKRLRQLSEALEQCLACPIIFKGTALAYTLYEEPSTRRRGDSDILVKENKFEEACNVLRALGFTAPVGGLSVDSLGARSFSLKDKHGFWHEIDLHQRINGSPLIAALFPDDELHSRSQPISTLGVGARALGPPDALLVACFHRLFHRQSPYYVDDKPYLSSDRLIWLYDIKLLHQNLTDSEKRTILELAEAKGLRAVLADGLRVADQWLKLESKDLIRSLGTAKALERPYRYLQSGQVIRWMLDMGATRHKSRAIFDLLAPPREYMERKYGGRPLRSNALAYIWRILHGLYKAVRRS